MTNPLEFRKLQRSDDASGFDCGQPALNQYIKNFAWANQRSDSAQNYVLATGTTIHAFYSLTVGSVLHEESPSRITKGLAKYPVPVMILARFAVDLSLQRMGIGRSMLKDALSRINNVADMVGIRACIVHAKDDKVREWYEKFGFEAGPADPYRMYLLMKDIRKSCSPDHA